MQRVLRLAGHLAPADAPSAGAAPQRPTAASATATSAEERGQVWEVPSSTGNSGHVCAALFEENTKGRVKTQLLTSKPEIWKNSTPRVRFPSGEVQEGKLYKVSDDPAELIPQSDIVIWTGPVNHTKETFAKIKPYLDTRKTVVGMIFAQGLVHVLAKNIFGSDVRFFALRNIPWLCRAPNKGEEAAIVGGKTSIDVTTINLDQEFIKREVEPLFVMQKTGKWEPVIEFLPDFCPVVFNPANQIIHPACYWGLFRNWHGTPIEDTNEWLYRGMDEVAGHVLEVLDEELQQLKNAYFQATGATGCTHVIPLRDRLLKQYGDQIEDKTSMARMIATNKAYSMAKTPVIRSELGVSPDPNHRVVTDDIGWGLCPLVSIAERLEVDGFKTPTSTMRMLIEWHEKMMSKEFLVNGRLGGRDCAELVLLQPSDPLEMVAR
ncbi:unnamed protein product [Prorocentrum cordatum]|uniref:Opine dehydrogenase domain-containing protein n=1 Tax=Prorocentrum cordatum TaxID=2364126 RepID=A0ABN9WCQ6_9DINO|nr:unnamed protein product [Polarella glacialis]